jgi:hypothetical protein
MIDRALIIRDIWLDLILDGSKIWEMRSAKTKIRGKVGLIKAGSGLIVGEVEIVDSLDALPLDEYSQHIMKHKIPKGLPGVREKWKYPWVLKNAIRYKNPIPYNHPKGAVIWVKL